MIPKIIHYCWLSGDAYPEDIVLCIKSWKEKLPDYEIVLWDTNRFDINQSVWVKEAYENKKYAFAADYIRIYALYNYGGIYLDSDVEVLKSFDNLLHLPYFIGKENTPSGIEAATMGFEKGNPLLKLMLDYYESRHFEIGIGKFATKPLPFIIRECIDTNFKYISIKNVNEFDISKKHISVLPVDYFSPKSWNTGEIHTTENTYSIHHFSGSWVKHKSIVERFRSIFDRVIKNLVRIINV